MATRININNDREEPFYSNAATYVPFGWDFQAAAGIFLFLLNIKEVDKLKVESKYQDIELHKDDGSMIFAQAKALQNPKTKHTEGAKLRDALESLVMTPVEDKDTLIYISNLDHPILNDSELYKNKCIGFNDMPSEHIDELNKNIDKLINKIELEIKNKASSSYKIGKNRQVIDRLKELKKNNFKNFKIATIYPFTQDTDSRYDKIKDKLSEKLDNIIGTNANSVNRAYIARSVIEVWMNIMRINETIEDANNGNYDSKSKTKKDLIWIIVTKIIDEFDIEKNLSNLGMDFDQCYVDATINFFNNEDGYHERFEFLNDVLQGYDNFKKVNKLFPKMDIKFVKENWEDYKYEFSFIDDEVVMQLITCCYMLKIIQKNRILNNFGKEINL